MVNWRYMVRLSLIVAILSTICFVLEGFFLNFIGAIGCAVISTWVYLHYEEKESAAFYARWEEDMQRFQEEREKCIGENI